MLRNGTMVQNCNIIITSGKYNYNYKIIIIIIKLLNVITSIGLVIIHILVII